MEKTDIVLGSIYRTPTGTLHRVDEIAGQKVLFEEVTEHGHAIEGEPTQEDSRARFAAQHRPWRIPAQVFPPAEFIADELRARRWSPADLAKRMPGDLAMNQFIVDMMLCIRDDKNLILDSGTAFALGQALGVNPRFFINMDRTWRGLPSLDA